MVEPVPSWDEIVAMLPPGGPRNSARIMRAITPAISSVMSEFKAEGMKLSDALIAQISAFACVMGSHVSAQPIVKRDKIAELVKSAFTTMFEDSMKAGAEGDLADHLRAGGFKEMPSPIDGVQMFVGGAGISDDEPCPCPRCKSERAVAIHDILARLTGK